MHAARTRAHAHLLCFTSHRLSTPGEAPLPSHATATCAAERRAPSPAAAGAPTTHSALTADRRCTSSVQPSRGGGT
jgi:hypothetical protein